MYGITGLEHRVGLLSEGLQVLKSLWTEERTNFDGRYFRMRDAVANPKPVQKPYPPIWIGSGGPATLRLTARHADVWNVSGSAGRTLEGAIEASGRLDEACAAIGRDPGAIRRSVQVAYAGGAAATAEVLGRYVEAGFSELIVMVGPSGGGGGPADPPRAAAEVAERVLPGLRKQRGR